MAGGFSPGVAANAGALHGEGHGEPLPGGGHHPRGDAEARDVERRSDVARPHVHRGEARGADGQHGAVLRPDEGRGRREPNVDEGGLWEHSTARMRGNPFSDRDSSPENVA